MLPWFVVEGLSPEEAVTDRESWCGIIQAGVEVSVTTCMRAGGINLPSLAHLCLYVVAVLQR